MHSPGPVNSAGLFLIQGESKENRGQMDKDDQLGPV